MYDFLKGYPKLYDCLVAESISDLEKSVGVPEGFTSIKHSFRGKKDFIQFKSLFRDIKTMLLNDFGEIPLIQ